jgi:hypothetical protein
VEGDKLHRGDDQHRQPGPRRAPSALAGHDWQRQTLSAQRAAVGTDMVLFITPGAYAIDNLLQLETPAPGKGPEHKNFWCAGKRNN